MLPLDKRDSFELGLEAMTRITRDLRRLPVLPSMEETAERVVDYLYDGLRASASGGRVCTLVRCFMSHPLETLDEELRARAIEALGPGLESKGMRCLALLATRGDLPAWNDRRRSVGHQVIPLIDAERIAAIPMLARLFDQLGVPLDAVLAPDPEFVLDAAERTYNVFHVQEAIGSPYIPQQEDFVRQFGVRSVVGYGGILPSGDLFSVILFSRLMIGKETAELFKTIALSTKIALVPHVGGRLLRPDPRWP